MIKCMNPPMKLNSDRHIVYYNPASECWVKIEYKVQSDFDKKFRSMVRDKIGSDITDILKRIIFNDIRET